MVAFRNVNKHKPFLYISLPNGPEFHVKMGSLAKDLGLKALLKACLLKACFFQPGCYRLKCSAGMTVCFGVWLADVPTTWIPGLAIGAIGYVLWLYCRDLLQQRRAERHRRLQRLAHWGHE